MYTAMRGLRSTYGPTLLHKTSLEIAKAELSEIVPQLKQIAEQEIPELQQSLQDAGAPYIEGVSAPKN